MTIEYKPTCKLTGENGNVYTIVGLVKRCLQKNDMADRAVEFQRKAFAAQSYDEVLQLAMNYVEVC